MSRVLFLCTLVAYGQGPKTLTLAEAQAIAIKNHPRLKSSALNARAASEVTRQVKSAKLPALVTNITGVGAQHDTSSAAGNLTTSSLASRLATGFTASQLLYDFGRVGSLTKSAELREEAQKESTQATRQQILLQVRASYFQALRAQSLLKVAEETLAERRITLRQVTRLFENKLRSSLDASFAEVNFSEAELLLYRADNEIKAAMAELAAAMGLDSGETFALAGEPLPAALDSDPAQFIQAATRTRPELTGLRLQRDAALQSARAEKSLMYPTVSAIAGAGVIPAHEEKLHGTYSAAGINISIPVFNGSLYSARRAEAELRAEAANHDVRDLEIRIARDVKVAWLNAGNAFKRLDITARLMEQAARSLRLAQARYDLGLSSVVEFTQAQLNKTSAEIANASAIYDYQIQRSILDFQSGALR